MEKDKYDRAVEYLTERPHEIHYAWHYPRRHVAGCLFQSAGMDGLDFYESRPDGLWCGCLTQIRGSDSRVAWTDELTKQIQADENIPTDPALVTATSLPHFANWQRRLDKELNRQ